jgi:hypothetical protein
MRNLLIAIIATLVIGCSTGVEVDHCEQVIFNDYIHSLNKASFIADTGDFFIDLPPERGNDLIKGERYEMCFDKHNNFVSLD